ncbi:MULTISPECIES: hypothetical protein [Chryseobacterium]|uniref:Uncharacterized protein n=1 Tax=Chryseobacterium scophthalmum TaxID=59733 RepID=A0A1N6ER85_9FLAO|nr:MULTISPECIES: hypothetical protein [Chryseobacterium]MBM7420041.1 hypothetical protein [Chryseobacterium sp. JUb44]MBW3521508.1 hypothetical protein [Chryseobacterium sp. NKUCC03_KSP]MDH6209979.1 hypothetical protein [Chryseobacterium sp. BIGb0186]WSO08711.1 hypothetical protein VUJ64_12840 [Chryseobacterium scophthalmum]SIN85490.1 hypothetical protein SAMN05421769_0612 [Chryseobacterium scophthalmum]
METKEAINEENVEKKSRWKKMLKKFGIGGIIFFTVKGIITSTLIYFLGKNFWSIISGYFTGIFQ